MRAPGTPATAARASRPPSSVPGGPPPTPAAPGPWRARAGETGALPTPRRPGRRAAASVSPAATRPLEIGRHGARGPRRTPAQWRAAGGGPRTSGAVDSRSCRIGSLEAAIQGVLSLKETPGSPELPIGVQRGPEPDVHDHRNPCSPCRNPRSASPESVFRMAGIGVQLRPESAFSFNRNQRSAWAGARTRSETIRLPRPIDRKDRPAGSQRAR